MSINGCLNRQRRLLGIFEGGDTVRADGLPAQAIFPSSQIEDLREPRILEDVMGIRHTFSPEARLIQAHVRMWGVRGSFVTQEQRIGGHTTCMSIEIGRDVIIIDAGTGMIDLADYLSAKYLTTPDSRLNITFISTHLHQDHIAGFSSFHLVFDPRVRIHVIGSTHGGYGDERLNTEWVLKNIVFRPPFFPVPWEAIKSRFTFEELNPKGDMFKIPLELGQIEGWTLPMFHPNDAYGIRLNIFGEIIACTFDHEAHPDLDRHIMQLWDGAKVVITEVQYTEVQYLTREGWGHISDVAAGRHIRDARLAKGAIIRWTHHDTKVQFDDLFSMGERMTDISGIRTEPAIQGSSFLF